MWGIRVQTLLDDWGKGSTLKWQCADKSQSLPPLLLPAVDAAVDAVVGVVVDVVVGVVVGAAVTPLDAESTTS